MGVLVDVVPNHMGIAGGANAWWQDVLENGRTSAYAEYFDIDWRPLKEELRGKILLPVLGDHYGVVLERGELRLEYADGAFTVHYYETRLRSPRRPIRSSSARPGASDRICPTGAAGSEDDLRAAGVPEHHHRLRAAATPGRAGPDRIAERRREQIVAKRRLADLIAASPEVAHAHRGDGARPQRRCQRPERKRTFRCARPAAGCAVVPPLLVPHGGRGDQLPSLLRHQRAGRGAPGSPRGLRRGARPPPAADRQRRGDRAAHRPPGWALGSRRLLPRSAACGLVCDGKTARRPDGERGRRRA